MAGRTRRWCFTLNNPTELEKKEVAALGIHDRVTYLIIGNEKGENGTPHLQGYIEFQHPRALAGVKTLIHRAHWEGARGSSASNRSYCSKEGDFKEWGTISHQGARNDLSAVRQIIKTSRKVRDVLEVATSHQAVRHAEVCLNYEVVERDAPPVVLWIYGATGTGKTRCGWELFDKNDTWCWNSTKWFDGYDAHETVLFDDLRGEELPFAYFLRLLDRYPVKVEVKGGHRPFCPRNIIITSHHSPEEAFCHVRGENMAQLLRRITLVWSVERDGCPDVEQVRDELREVVGITQTQPVTDTMSLVPLTYSEEITEVPCTPGQD